MSRLYQRQLFGIIPEEDDAGAVSKTASNGISGDGGSERGRGCLHWGAALTAQLQRAFAERLAAQDAAHRAEIQYLVEECHAIYTRDKTSRGTVPLESRGPSGGGLSC